MRRVVDDGTTQAGAPTSASRRGDVGRVRVLTSGRDSGLVVPRGISERRGGGVRVVAPG